MGEIQVKNKNRLRGETFIVQIICKEFKSSKKFSLFLIKTKQVFEINTRRHFAIQKCIAAKQGKNLKTIHFLFSFQIWFPSVYSVGCIKIEQEKSKLVTLFHSVQ